MNIQSLKLVYFSPTGTTKAIIQSIACGISRNTAELIDITKPETRKKTLLTFENELLIIGVPVYIGRVPALITEWMRTIKAQNTPTVCVVVYGNRAYEDALLELKDILSSCGCKLIAGAAYIGEHSFSNDETPIAKDRPDKNDLHHAEMFGMEIKEKLNNLQAIEQTAELSIPGTHPYQRDGKLWVVDFIDVNNSCVNCGSCAEQCPTGAIDSVNNNMIDKEKCITCCACIKHCPKMPDQ